MTQHRVIYFMHCISDGNEAQYSRMASLKSHTHPDMVHLTTRGYKKLANCITTTAEQLAKNTRGLAAAGGDPRPLRGVECTGLHGFISTTGYGRVSRVTLINAGRSRGVRNHPYNRF